MTFGAFYSRLRASTGVRHRTQSRRHAELAVFIARANRGRSSWEQALDAWRWSNPGAYEQTADPVLHFRRDARATYQRATGRKIAWKDVTPPPEPDPIRETLWAQATAVGLEPDSVRALASKPGWLERTIEARE